MSREPSHEVEAIGTFRAEASLLRWSMRGCVKRSIHTASCAVAISVLSGCATIVMRSSISGSAPKGLYPATRGDVTGTYHYMRNELDPGGGWRGSGPSHRPSVLEKALWLVFATIDFPISIVTDTIFLPSDLADKFESKRSNVPPPPPKAQRGPAPGKSEVDVEGAGEARDQNAEVMRRHE